MIATRAPLRLAMLPSDSVLPTVLPASTTSSLTEGWSREAVTVCTVKERLPSLKVRLPLTTAGDSALRSAPLCTGKVAEVSSAVSVSDEACGFHFS